MIEKVITQRFSRQSFGLNILNRIIDGNFFYLIIFFLFALCVLAMVNGIATKSFLHDEAGFANNVNNFPQGLITSSAPSAPIFYTFTYFLVSLFGKYEWVYRLIPVVSGIIGLALMILFLMKYFSKLASLVTIFLLATSVPLIYYAGNAHPYATDFLCSSVLLILTYLNLKTSSNKLWYIWLFASFVSIGTSFSALFIIASMGILLLVDEILKKDRNKLRLKIITLIPMGIYTVFLIFLVFRKLCAEQENLTYWKIYFPENFIPWVFSKWAYLSTTSLFGYLFFAKFNHSFLHYQYGLVGLFLSILGTAWYIKKKDYLMCALACGPFLLTVLAAILHKWPYGPIRTMIFIIPFSLLLIGGGIEFIWYSVNSYSSKLLIIMASLSILLPQSWILKKGFEKPSDSIVAVRALSQVVIPEIKPHDYFLVYCRARSVFRFYFSQFVDRAIFQRYNATAPAEFVEQHIKKKKGRFWLIFANYFKEKDQCTIMVEAAKKHCRLLKYHTFNGCEAYLFEYIEN